MGCSSSREDALVEARAGAAKELQAIHEKQLTELNARIVKLENENVRTAELEKENGTTRAEVKMKTVRLQDAKQKLAERQQQLEQATACLGTLGM